MRIEAEEQRRKLDEEIQAANYADSKLQDVKKHQLKVMADADRKAKLL